MDFASIGKLDETNTGRLLSKYAQNRSTCSRRKNYRLNDIPWLCVFLCKKKRAQESLVHLISISMTFFIGLVVNCYTDLALPNDTHEAVSSLPSIRFLANDFSSVMRCRREGKMLRFARVLDLGRRKDTQIRHRTDCSPIVPVMSVKW